MKELTNNYGYRFEEEFNAFVLYRWNCGWQETGNSFECEDDLIDFVKSNNND